MMSDGNALRFISYKQALSPHQLPLGTCPSTRSSPPTLECCHNSSGVLIECKHPSLYCQWIEIMNDGSHHHLSMKQPSIGISYDPWDRDIRARYEGGLLNGTMRKMVRKTTVRWILPISLEIFIRNYCWSEEAGGLKGYHLLGGSSGRLVIRAKGLGTEGLVVISLEKSVGRISS
jgi:hypothetical protein